MNMTAFASCRMQSMKLTESLKRTIGMGYGLQTGCRKRLLRGFENEIDCYEKSDFKIDDLGYEGALYLYEDEPVKYLIT